MEPQSPDNTPSSTNAEAKAPTPVPVPLEQKIILQAPSPWGRFGWKIVVFALVVSLLVNVYLSSQQQTYSAASSKVNERFVSGDEKAKQKVAIVRLSGTIMKGDGFVKQQIDRALKDDDVKAIVLRVDTPGGTVTGSNYIYHYLKKLSEAKPVVVSMGGICTSGGYYIAMAAGNRENVMYAEPSTWTGSIGVIIPHYDLSKLLDKWDIKDDSITSGPDKQVGSPTRMLTPEEREKERAILQSLVDGSFEQFKEIVLEARKELKADEENQKIAFSGRIFSAKQAMELGLVDQIGFVEAAITRASELAGITSDEKFRVVRYTTHQPGLIEVLGGTEASSQPQWAREIRSLMRLAVPRPYYLPNWLPGVLMEPGAEM
ncbi:MAG: signal peptide peptidase SppA [Pirellulales bacterium]|nr:signal peptide peptidase SppA [Pirellulales bacterium]